MRPRFPRSVLKLETENQGSPACSTEVSVLPELTLEHPLDRWTPPVKPPPTAVVEWIHLIWCLSGPALPNMKERKAASHEITKYFSFVRFFIKTAQFFMALSCLNLKLNICFKLCILWLFDFNRN